MNDPKSMLTASGWQVDRSDDPGAFVKYLEASSESDVMRREVADRIRSHGVHGARTIVDIGCGIGTHVRLLAAEAGPEALVVGIDASAVLLQQARQRTPGRAGFALGDAHRLPLASGAFELAWVERALVHFANPVQALREIHRVLRPGGRAILTEADYSGVLLDCEDESLWLELKTRWLSNLKHPKIGRQLAKLLHRAGFESSQLDLELRRFANLAVLLQTTGLERHTAALVLEGKVDPRRADTFWAEQRAREREGCFFAAIPFVIARVLRAASSTDPRRYPPGVT